MKKYSKINAHCQIAYLPIYSLERTLFLAYEPLNRQSDKSKVLSPAEQANVTAIHEKGCIYLISHTKNMKLLPVKSNSSIQKDPHIRCSTYLTFYLSISVH